MRKTSCLLLAMLYLAFSSQAQSVDSSISSGIEIPGKLVNKIGSETNRFNEKISNNSEKYLNRFLKEERRLQQALSGIDSNAAKQIFSHTEARYQQLLQKVKSPLDSKFLHPLREYIPGLDSMQTALRFLDQNKNLINGLSKDQLEKLSGVNEEFMQLQGTIQQANEIQQFIKEREIELKNQLANFGLTRQLLGLNKQAVYYQQQLREFKELLKDRDRCTSSKQFGLLGRDSLRFTS